MTDRECKAWATDGYLFVSDAPEGTAVPGETERYIVSPDAVEVQR